LKEYNADVATYLAILAMVGPLALAVTINLNINFLRKRIPADILGYARLLTLERRLAVGEVTMYSDGRPEPVAHATVSYALPHSGA
jgi:acyl-coenzyme A thioesterase PaaI-like protein